ncbi:hypothetical protein Q8F55_006601 [Vanrija albida]|uniref:Uncharacterized protein n=1 Tax=Vanrija albida TaxID=181172 RepID=A0ABR3PXN8_9TREE
MHLASLLLLALPLALAQSPTASGSTSVAPSAWPNDKPLPSLAPPPGPGTPGSTALPVPARKGVTFSTPNATAYWVKGKGSTYNEAVWTSLYHNAEVGALAPFSLWVAHTNVSMLGKSSLVSNNLLQVQPGLDPLHNPNSTVFYAGNLDSVVPGPGYVAALIVSGNEIFAVSEPFEIKPEGTKSLATSKPSKAGRRAALPVGSGVALLVGAVGVLGGAALLV